MPTRLHPDKYLPPKPVLNTSGQYSIVITLSELEWNALDAKAKAGDQSRAALARAIIRMGLAAC